MLSVAALLIAHAYYVTICQIDHNVETASLEITFKFFTDDLENALREAGDSEARLTVGSDRDEADVLVRDYLNKKFILAVNDDCCRECLALIADTSLSGAVQGGAGAGRAVRRPGQRHMP